MERFYGEIKFYGRRKYIGRIGNSDGISGRDRMASRSGIDEARPRHKIATEWILESRQSSERKYIYISDLI